MRKTETSAPPWPSHLAYVSKEKLSPNLCGSLTLGLRSLKLRFFRSGNLFQAVLPLSYISTSSLRPLCSTVLTRFLATMGLSDSLQGPTAGYLFPTAVSAPAGLPGSSTDLSTRAAPSHPEESGDCSCPLLHRRFQASSSLADWPLSPLRNEAETGSLRCGSRVRLARLRQRSYPRPRLLGYLPTGNLQDILLSEYEISQAFPGASKGRKSSEK